MKKQLLPLLAVIPLLASCGGKELVIPTVDVEHLTINLPDRPVYSTTDIRSDGSYDYFDFYELSDFHGAVNYEFHDSGDYIGLPRLATYLDECRQDNEGGTIVLSSGDMFQGSADSNLTRGYMVNYAMNYMGFECMTLGNHEFDWTEEWIKKNANLDYKGRKIPYLAANLIDKRTGNMPDFVSKSHIISRGDYKIGVIGTIGSELENSVMYSVVKDFDFKEDAYIVQQEAAALREQGCDIVIWSTHNGVTDLSPVSGVDAIFGGHAHENKAIEKGVPMVATKNYGRGIGHIELKIDKVTKEVSCENYECLTPYVSDTDTTSGNLTELNYALIEEDPNMKSIINQFDNSIGEIKNIKLGKCEETLELDQELKCLCVDTMRKSAAKAIDKLGLDVPKDKIIAAYHNINGGIRSNIEAGDITYNDVYRPFPFDNEIVMFKTKGSDFRTKCLELQNLAIWRAVTSRFDIKSDEEYYVVTTDFLALSESYIKGTYPNLTDSDLIRTGLIVRDEVANEIYQLKKVKSADYNSEQACFSQFMRA